MIVLHLRQFNVDKQKTQPTPLVELHVNPVAQQPAALEGNKEKLVLQVVQVLAVLHLKQFKISGHATQEKLAVLQVTV